MTLRKILSVKYLSLFTSMLMLSLLGLKPAQAQNRMYDIKYNPVVAGETRFEFVFDQPIAGTPDIQVINNPARIRVKLPEATFEQFLANTKVDSAGVENITVEQKSEDIQIELLMDSLKVYKSKVNGNTLELHVSDNSGFSKVQDKKEFVNQIEALDFRTNEDKGGRVLVFLENSMAAVDVQEKQKSLSLVFHNTDIVPDLLYQMDVTDFATIVDSIETFREKGQTRIEIKTSDLYAYQYQQLDNIFTIDLIKDEEKGAMSSEKKYEGSPISLNFQDIDVRTVLQIIADYNGFNLVTSDSVSGQVTLRLDGVPWDQALDIILKVKGLDKRMEGSILLVAPSEEIAAREAKELEAKNQVEKLAPLYSEYFQVNYAKASDIAEMLRNQETNMLSDRGRVSVDQRTNTLLMRDTEDSLKNIRKLVEILDIPVKQVTIESRIVTVNDNLTEEFGIRWGFSDQDGADGVSGTLSGAETIGGGTIPSMSDRLNVNLPVSSSSAAGSIGFSIARLADGTILDLELSALESENQGEIIASPRITTANQKTAYIEQGTEIPFVQASSSGATAVTFKKAVLSLEVTPQITPDNKIILDLVITQDTRGDTVQTATGSAVAIDTQEIGTQVLVDNGETIVLGGIYQQQLVSSEKKVPLLGDIPYLGRLFKTTNEFNEKKELLIFVTPKIVTEKL
ncbi:type IV pilus secretin PilQ family protein [Gayadomonas joobiniege]|uniref:type IV pilus secretin PilQ n=1 Tax=Gayadomonas joobiniege TaxID=1234606 RepID=UPI000A5354E0